MTFAQKVSAPVAPKAAPSVVKKPSTARATECRYALALLSRAFVAGRDVAARTSWLLQISRTAEAVASELVDSEKTNTPKPPKLSPKLKEGLRYFIRRSFVETLPLTATQSLASLEAYRQHFLSSLEAGLVACPWVWQMDPTTGSPTTMGEVAMTLALVVPVSELPAYLERITVASAYLASDEATASTLLQPLADTVKRLALRSDPQDLMKDLNAVLTAVFALAGCGKENPI